MFFSWFDVRKSCTVHSLHHLVFPGPLATVSRGVGTRLSVGTVITAAIDRPVKSDVRITCIICPGRGITDDTVSTVPGVPPTKPRSSPLRTYSRRLYPGRTTDVAPTGLCSPGSSLLISTFPARLLETRGHCGRVEARQSNSSQNLDPVTDVVP